MANAADPDAHHASSGVMGHSALGFSLNALLADNRFALFILLTLFGILCSLIAQIGIRNRTGDLPSANYSPSNSHQLPADGSEKARFESLRSRAVFSLRPGLDSPRNSRPHSRTHSPSTSVTSDAGKSSRTRRLKARSLHHENAQLKHFRSGDADEERAENDNQQHQHHAFQSLSFADRIAVKFRTVSHAEATGDQHLYAHEQLHGTGDQHQTSTPSRSRSQNTSQDQTFQLNQLLDPITDEQRALRKIYDDLLASRSAEADLGAQLAAQSATAATARASLEATLEALRGRRKADDSERASLRSRVKALDEERRLAESKKRDVEKKLESWSAKVRALEKEWEDGKRAQSSAKDTRVSLRDGWKRREEEALRRRQEVEQDIQGLLQLQATANETYKDTTPEPTSPHRAHPPSGRASKTSPKSSHPQTPGAGTAVPGNRDHNNAKVVRDRIKTLEGQIKKERERLERVKRSAQTASAAAGVGSVPAKDGQGPIVKGRNSNTSHNHQQHRPHDKLTPSHVGINNALPVSVAPTSAAWDGPSLINNGTSQAKSSSSSSSASSVVTSPLQALQPYSDLQLPTWIRSSVFGGSGAPGDRGSNNNSTAGFNEGTPVAGLPSFISRPTALEHGSIDTIGRGLLGPRATPDALDTGNNGGSGMQNSTAHLPWDWPAFRSDPLMGLGNGGAGFSSSVISPSANPAGSGIEHGRSSLHGLFSSSDATVLPLHTRPSQSIPTVSVSAAATTSVSSPFRPNDALPLPSTAIPATSSSNLTLTPIKMSTPQMGSSNLSPDLHQLTPSGSSSGGGGGKPRPRTNAPRRRARTPVSPYSAGLLPRNLLSYPDDEEEDDEMAALNEMESAWASLEEDELEEEEGMRA